MDKFKQESINALNDPFDDYWWLPIRPFDRTISNRYARRKLKQEDNLLGEENT